MHIHVCAIALIHWHGKRIFSYFGNDRYIYQLTMGGFALIFPVDMVGREMQNDLFNDDGGDSAKINLRATTYRYVTLSMEKQLLPKHQPHI
jgi:hypothetical protein